MHLYLNGNISDTIKLAGWYPRVNIANGFFFSSVCSQTTLVQIQKEESDSKTKKSVPQNLQWASKRYKIAGLSHVVPFKHSLAEVS